MSKATRQSCTLLAVIGGCMFEMSRRKMFSSIAMRDHVNETYQLVAATLEKWPKLGDDAKNRRWITEKIEVWRRMLNDDDEFILTILAAIAEQCLADLHTVTKDRFKKGMLDNLDAPIHKIHAFSDPSGVNYPAYEEASRLMRGLYDEIAWEW